jgi:hypothetical protein
MVGENQGYILQSLYFYFLFFSCLCAERGGSGHAAWRQSEPCMVATKQAIGESGEEQNESWERSFASRSSSLVSPSAISSYCFSGIVGIG